MRTCALKQYLYKGDRCERCLGIPTVRCYTSLDEFNKDKQFFYEMFLREHESDNGRLEELPATARSEKDLCQI